MKKSLIFKSLIVLFSIISFVSCETEPLDPELDLNDFQNPSDSNNPNNPNNPGTSTGDYWPTAINNEWVFEQTGTTDLIYKMVGTDVFDNQTYYRFDPISADGSSTSAIDVVTWLNKNGSNYTLKYDDIVFDAGGLAGSISGFEVLILKDDLAVNQTWTGSYNQTTTFTGIPPISQTTNYTGTILAKDVTEIVDGVSYTNVIKCKIDQNTNIGGNVTSTSSEYWFSKDVGPLKIVITSEGSTASESILVDYSLF